MSTQPHKLLIEAIDGRIDEEIDNETVRDFYERITEGVFVIDENWRLTYLNQMAKELFEQKESEILEKDIFEVFPDAEESAFYDNARETMEEQRRVSFEYYHESIDSWFYFDLYPSEGGVSAYFRDITDKKETERELKIRTESIEKSNIPFVLIDPNREDNPIVYANEGFENLTGYKEEEVLGKNGRLLRGEGTDPEDEAELDHAVEERESKNVEILNYKKDGTPFWNQVHVSPVYEDGEVVHLVASQRDVTEKKEREQELERYEALLENTTDVISHLDEEGNILYQTPSVELILGHAQEERMGENVFDYVHPDDRAHVFEKFTNLLEEGTKFEEVEYRFKKDDGSYVWIESVGHDKRNSDLGGVVVSSRDITQRKEREQRIRKMKERLDLAVDAADLGVWEWDLRTGECKINGEWNNTVVTESGHNKTTLENWEEIVHPDDNNWDTIERHLEGETENFDIEFRVQTQQQEWEWIRSIGQVVERDENGDAERAVGVHIDIDDRKRRERQLERQNKYLRRIKESSQEMIGAESQKEVKAVLVSAGDELFDEAEFYTWESGVLRSEEDGITDRDNPIWQAFTKGKTVISRLKDDGFEVIDDADDLSRLEYTEETDCPVCLDTPVGEDGVLSIRMSSFSETVVDFVDSLMASAKTSLHRVEKEERLQEATDKLQDKNKKLQNLSEMDEILHELLEKIIEADSRESMEEIVCDQVLEVEVWEYACFVEKDKEGVEFPCCCGDDNFSEDVRGLIDGSPLLKSLEDGEARIVDDVAKAESSDWRRTVLNEGYLSVATIPIQHGPRFFGVFEVYSSEAGAFKDEYVDTLTEVGKVLGYAFTSVEQVSSILSGGYHRLTLGINHDEVDCFFAELVERLGTWFRISTIVPGSDGTVVYFKTEADGDELHEAADEMGVKVSKTVDGYSVTVSEMSVVDEAVELGGRVVRYGVDGDSLVVDVDLPQETSAQNFVNLVSKEYSNVDLVAQKSCEQLVSSSKNLPLENLTQRQETALQLAYESGFFETPRRKTGEELAEEMDITATTFFQHLRSAEKIIIDNLFDGR